MVARGKTAAICVTVVAILVIMVMIRYPHIRRQVWSSDTTSKFSSKLSTTSDTWNKTQWKSTFTTDELMYVLYGEGNATVSSRDSRYLGHLRSMIARPSPRPSTAVNSQLNKFAEMVDERLRGKERGFFIECGAANGDTGSNTMLLERKRNWTGLLVEANKRYVKEILKKNRQAYVFGGCLSPFKHPVTLQFKAAGDQGGLPNHLGNLDDAIARIRSFESMDLVYCVPLDHLLASIDVRHVDFLSLDVQGAELAILETIDFNTVQIDIIIVEAEASGSADLLRKFFLRTGIYTEKKSNSRVDIWMERVNLN